MNYSVRTQKERVMINVNIVSELVSPYSEGLSDGNRKRLDQQREFEGGRNVEERSIGR